MTEMKPTRKRRRKPDKPELKPLYIFFGILGLSGLWLAGEISKPVYPSPPTFEPGLVPVTLGNAGPEPMDIMITSATGKIYSVRLPKCPTCTVHTLEPPKTEACPTNTTYKQFALAPDAYKVDVYTNGAITYSSPLNLANGIPFESCVFLLRFASKHRNLQDDF